MHGQGTAAIDTSPSAPHSRLWLKRALRLALLAGAIVVAWQVAARWREPSAAPRYTLAEVKRGDLRSQVTASGTLDPLVQVDVGSQVSGRVKELYVDFNDEVKKGQLVALIDPVLFESDVAQAQARLASARAALERAQAQAADARTQYQRVTGLVESGTVARADLDTAITSKRVAEAAVVSARADVTLAKAALDQAQANLTYTKITSPIDGVVVSRSVDVGQTVAASLSAPTLFVIAGDLRKMEVHTNVAEADVGQITPGQEAEFTVDAYPDRTFEGTVRQVRYAPQTVSNVVTYDAVVTVENEDLKLRPGMTVNVSFIVDERRDVMTVPNAAFRYRPAGAEPQRGRVVWVLRDEQPVAVPVRTGLSDGSATEIVEGDLRPGDSIILGDGSAPAAAAGQDRQGGQSGQSGRGGNRRGDGPRRPPSIL
jgi:HlyD family secretion protein